MQAFSIDRESAIPVKVQLQAQIKYQIATGLLLPGDQLPPLRDLAAGLSIHLNTVIRAVEELAAQGYLYSHPGKGVFVSEEADRAVPGAALRSLLAGVMAPAREWGMGPEEMALALLAQSRLARQPQAASHRLLLVATSRRALRLLQRELERALPWLTVLPRLPEELDGSGTPPLVAATLFHSLTEPPQGQRVVALAGPREREQLGQLRSLPSGAGVAIAAEDWVEAARIRQSLEAAGLTHLRFHMAVRPDELREAAEGASFLLATAGGRRMAEEARALRPDLPTLVEPVQVTQEGLAAIQRVLGKPRPPQRVQLRSSWV